MQKRREKTNKLWFKAKEYGWGWYPSSWEGWLSLGIFILFYIIILVWLVNQINLLNIIFGILIILILLIVLFFICYKKGEKPGWRWGGKSLKKRRKKMHSHAF